MALEFLIYGCSVVNRIISNVMANGQLLDFRTLDSNSSLLDYHDEMNVRDA